MILGAETEFSYQIKILSLQLNEICRFRNFLARFRLNLELVPGASTESRLCDAFLESGFIYENRSETHMYRYMSLGTILVHIFVRACILRFRDPPLRAGVRVTTVLRAQEELDKFLKNGRGKNIDPLDLLFFGGLTLLQMEISMLQAKIGDLANWEITDFHL